MSRRADALSGLALGLLGLVLLTQSADSRAQGSPRSPTPVAEAGPQAPREIASYTLDARLDVPGHLITGKGTLRWTNASTEPTRELWFHLYLNAFKNDKTVFLRSPFGAGRSGDHATDWGYIDVSRLSIRELGGKDLWPAAAKTSPGDADDQTDIRLPLPDEVAPGATLHIDFEWTSRLPSIVERCGYSGNFHLVSHWFPKIARREPDGRWAHFSFHPQAEFYADFGRYHVTLDVPSEMVLGATGRQTQVVDEGRRRRATFEAPAVHDFAWTAWPDFRERRQGVEGVDVRLLYPPGHDANAEDGLRAVRFALPRFSRLYGSYPHPTLTIVHPPEHAQNAGGMEYPTFITTGGPWWSAWSGLRAVEGVTVHELGHQWFQGIIATNEYEWPFLDEGLNTFAEVRALDAQYGPRSLFSFAGLSVSGSAARRAFAIPSGHDNAIAQPAARFYGFRSVGALVYARTAIALETVGNAFGHAALERALSSYTERERFGHPTPKSFLFEVKKHVGADAHDALHAALFDKGWVDYEVADLSCVPSAAPSGVFGDDTERQTTPRPAAAQKTEFACRAVVRRKGTLRFPVTVELHFEGGHRERRRWEGHEEWATFDATGSRALVAAVVDPDREILLDETFANNARKKQREFGHRTLERLTYAGQLLLGFVGP